jgi:PAS domain S-box-containing protein
MGFKPMRKEKDREAARKVLLLYGALPIAYVVLGRLGLSFATSPGYATAVFLPAGIAIAATLVTGVTALPGIFIGSFVLNLWVSYANTQELTNTTIAAAVAIASASGLQAGIGGRVLRRTIGHPSPLSSPRDLLVFLLASPLVCLTSATISVAAIWMLGVTARNAVPMNWMTWWVGDTLGLLTALPIMLVFVGQPRPLWRLRLWYVAVPMLLCFASFVGIFAWVESWQETSSLTEFKLHSQQLGWLLLAGGVLGTGLLEAFLMLGTGYAYRVRAKERELEAIIDRTPFMLTRCTRDLRYRFVSQSYAQMVGRQPEEVIGQPIAEIMGVQGSTTISPYVEKVLRGEQVEYEDEVQFQGVGNRILRVVYSPDKTDRGNVEGWIASIIDVTEQKRAETQRNLLTAEVNHRVKNTLATVISVAHQSFKGQKSVDDSILSFENRIQALARTHSRLSDTNWSGAALHTILADEIAPYRAVDNVHIAGPEVVLNPKCAINLGMAFHELATNAAKHGALSVKGGFIRINWSIAPLDSEVRLSWIESGGPQVSGSQQSGFGRLLLEKVLPANLNGAVRLDFHPAGLACLITFRADQQGDGTATANERPSNSDAQAKRIERHLAGAYVLLVEDEALVGIELEELFNSAGCHVIGPFGNLSRAMEAAQSETINVAILDTNLNGEFVYPLAELLRGRCIPFLFLTGYDASDLPEKFRATPRISKPFDRTDLIRQVEGLVSR